MWYNRLESFRKCQVVLQFHNFLFIPSENSTYISLGSLRHLNLFMRDVTKSHKVENRFVVEYRWFQCCLLALPLRFESGCKYNLSAKPKSFALSDQSSTVMSPSNYFGLHSLTSKLMVSLERFPQFFAHLFVNV